MRSLTLSQKKKKSKKNYTPAAVASRLLELRHSLAQAHGYETFAEMESEPFEVAGGIQGVKDVIAGTIDALIESAGDSPMPVACRYVGF
jgi:Zn-dependent oligopeptidase